MKMPFETTLHSRLLAARASRQSKWACRGGRIWTPLGCVRVVDDVGKWKIETLPSRVVHREARRDEAFRDVALVRRLDQVHLRRRQRSPRDSECADDSMDLVRFQNVDEVVEIIVVDPDCPRIVAGLPRKDERLVRRVASTQNLEDCLADGAIASCNRDVDHADGGDGDVLLLPSITETFQACPLYSMPLSNLPHPAFARAKADTCEQVELGVGPSPRTVSHAS